MKWLLRMFMFWCLGVPIFYICILPLLMDKLTKKAQEEGLTQCTQQMKTEGLSGTPNSPYTQQQSDNYCHCISDNLIVTKPDLFEMVRHKPPTALTALSQTLADQCTADLQRQVGMSAAPQQPAPADATAAPQPAAAPVDPAMQQQPQPAAPAGAAPAPAPAPADAGLIHL